MIKLKCAFLVILSIIFYQCKYKEDIDLNNSYLYPRLDEKVNLESNSADKFSNHIDRNDIKNLICTFSDDYFKGRATGEEGQKKAAEFIKRRYKSLDVQSPEGLDYFQKIPANFFQNKARFDSENVLGFIRGKELPNEYLIISAHYDHLGVKNKEIYNGADDNASGTIAVLEIAEAFKRAEKEGFHPKRSIVFFHTTGEEIGLFGSKFYVENPIFSLENTIANLNIDMVGRIDLKHENNSDYLYVIGSNRLSTELHTISELVNRKYFKLDLDYSFNGLFDKNKFYEKSDHYHFAKNNIPIIFYFNGTHKDFHKPTDIADDIEYSLLTRRTRYIFQVAWELANRVEKPRLDID